MSRLVTYTREMLYLKLVTKGFEEVLHTFNWDTGSDLTVLIEVYSLSRLDILGQVIRREVRTKDGKVTGEYG